MCFFYFINKYVKDFDQNELNALPFLRRRRFTLDKMQSRVGLTRNTLEDGEKLVPREVRIVVVCE